MRTNEERLRAMMIAGLDGNAEVYRIFLKALSPLLRSYFRRHLRDASDEAEDLVQETLMAIHMKRSTYDPSRPFTAWLYAIARYKLIDYFRRTHPHSGVEEIDHIPAAEDFEAMCSARIDIERLLDTLPAKQACVIRETKIEGLCPAETARRHGLTEANVRVSVHRGLKALAARMRGN